METVEDVHHALRPGDWAASIDLRDTYFHVSLHPSTRKYAVRMEGKILPVLLPLGLSPAPKVFTSLTQFIKVNFR
jgi:hypothetical protein